MCLPYHHNIIAANFYTPQLSITLKLFHAKDRTDRQILFAQILLSSIAGDPGLPILSLNFIDVRERETVLQDFNNTWLHLPEPHAGATIHGLFEHWVDSTPQAPALTYKVGKTFFPFFKKFWWEIAPKKIASESCSV